MAGAMVQDERSTRSLNPEFPPGLPRPYPPLLGCLDPELNPAARHTFTDGQWVEPLESGQIQPL